jgi:hypothetical protein
LSKVFFFSLELFVVDDNKLFSEWKYMAGAAAVALLAAADEEEVARR